MKKEIGKAMLVFLAALAILIAVTVLFLDDPFRANNADAKLYLSIADNFVENGHFIQTARGKVKMVVPFGFPVFLTLLRLCGLGTVGITCVQYVIIAATATLLYRAEANLFGKGLFAPAIFIFALLYLHLRPDILFVEHLYMFWLALLLCIVTEKQIKPGKKIVWMNAAAFLAFVTRPALAPIYLTVLGYSLYCLIKKKIGIGRMAALLLVPALIMTANAAVNQRETGHWIWLENYSARDICYANNYNTKTGWYTTQQRRDFSDEETLEIYSRKDLDATEKSVLYKEHAREYARNNFGKVVKYAAIKGNNMFLKYWKYLTVLTVLGAIGILVQCPDKRRITAIILAMDLLLAVMT